MKQETTRFTKLIAPQGRMLAKQFHIKNGDIEKVTSARFDHGEAATLELQRLEDLKQVILGLDRNEALMTGVTDLPSCNVITTKKLCSRRHESGFRARTKEYFSQPSPGLLLFDHDHSLLMPNALRCRSPEQVMALLAAIPELRGLEYLGTTSSSADVRNDLTGEEHAAHGLHIYVAARATDMERVKLWFEVRLWLAGLGYIGYARNGALLVKALLDTSVLSPERLIFEAPPVLGPGLSQSERRFVHRPGAILEGDFHVSERELAEYRDLVAAAKQDEQVIHLSGVVRTAYVHHRARMLAKAEGIELTPAIARVKRAMPEETPEGIHLPADYLLDMGKVHLKAGELLKVGAKFHGWAIPDPIEGREYGLATAKYYHNNGSPVIHSFAHGRKLIYHLPMFEARTTVVAGQRARTDNPT